MPAKPKLWCRFCGDKAAYSYDYVPFCAQHFVWILWAMSAGEWHD